MFFFQKRKTPSESSQSVSPAPARTSSPESAPEVDSRRKFLRMSILGGAALPVAVPSLVKAACEASTPDMLGPYYTPDARVSAATGKGLKVHGVIREANTCTAIAGATVERWHANPYGYYEDEYRTQQKTDANGAYSFETIMPGLYGGRPRHLHYKITAPGYKEFVTQSYFPNERDLGGPPETDITFDLYLEKA